MDDIEDIHKHACLQRVTCNATVKDGDDAPHNCQICPHFTAAATSVKSSNDNGPGDLGYIPDPNAYKVPVLRPPTVNGTKVIVKSDEFPVINPYGDKLSLDTLIALRLEESIPQTKYREGVTNGTIKPQSDRDRYMYLGEKGEWPYYRKGFKEYISNHEDREPHRSTEANKTFMPMLEQFVKSVRDGKPPTPYEPKIINGYDTYCNPSRDAAEQKVLFGQNPVVVGCSQDLPGPDSYKRIVIAGKSMILTRDSSGKIHCFENACRHRGMELVRETDNDVGKKPLFVCPYHSWVYNSSGELVNVPFEEGFANDPKVHIEDRGLIEVPSKEIIGLLYIIPSPKPNANIDELFKIAMPDDLMKELSVIHFEKFKSTVEQTVKVNANWKLGVDTFGESYHFSTVHPNLKLSLVPNRSVFRTFGGETGDNSCMTLGNFTTRVIVEDNIDKKEWANPSVIDHLTQVYHLAPNLVILLGGTLTFNYFWPGESPEVSYVKIVQYETQYPKTAGQRNLSAQSFTGLMDVVATEDFPLLPRMQSNFSKNKHMELVFGRHEPMLTNRHNYFERKIAGENWERKGVKSKL